MTAMIRVEVRGIPQPQGSKRHVGNGVMVESAQGVKPWRDSIIAAIRERVDVDDWLWLGPVWVNLTFTFPRPASHFGSGRNAKLLRKSAPGYYKMSRPDLDKLTRAALDAVTQAGGVWRDDSQVAVIGSEKRWGHAGHLTLCVGGLT